jgi:predicted nucleic acid-binding protein
MGLMITQGYLLDTNIAIGMVDGEREILELISQAALHRKKIYFSVVTECEFISGMASEDEATSVPFLKSGRFLEITSTIARIAGNVRREQRQKGRRLKTPDALILATAIEHQLILVSRDRDLLFAQNEYDVKVVKP